MLRPFGHSVPVDQGQGDIDVLTCMSGIPERAAAARWAKEIEDAHPDYHQTKVLP